MDQCSFGSFGKSKMCRRIFRFNPNSWIERVSIRECFRSGDRGWEIFGDRVSRWNNNQIKLILLVEIETGCDATRVGVGYIIGSVRAPSPLDHHDIQITHAWAPRWWIVARQPPGKNAGPAIPGNSPQKCLQIT